MNKDQHQERLKIISQRIKTLMFTRQVNQRQLAKAANTSRICINRILTGRDGVGLNLLMRIVLALDTDMNYICGFEGNIDMKAIYLHKLKRIKEILED